jgi:hypothetical protein
MLKCYPPHSVQRSQLAEAIAIASKIAKCEPNPQTIRATVMYCLERNVEGFPVSLGNQGSTDNRQTYSATIDRSSIPSTWTKQTHGQITHPPPLLYPPSRQPALPQLPVPATYTAPCSFSTISSCLSNANRPRYQEGK